MADSIVETPETTPVVVDKETVTSSVKESPVKETNGSGAEKENGNGDVAVPEAEEAPKENGAESEEPKENGDNTDSCGIKRKSCTGEADTPEVTTPEKKAKLAEEESNEESNDAEAVEA